MAPRSHRRLELDPLFGIWMISGLRKAEASG
jgi:hypothetical protein